MESTPSADGSSSAGGGGANVLLLPIPGAQGHTNPMLQFGRRLAYHGLHPTLVATRYVLSTTPPPGDPFRVAAISDGFDAGGLALCPDMAEYLSRLEAVGSETLRELLASEARAGRPVRVLVYDPHLPWPLRVARAAGVPAAAFFSQPCAVNICQDPFTIDKWRPYLQRGPFTILTDHKSLVNLQDQQLGTDLQRKAMAKMVGLQFQLRYKKGIENGAADSLSRVAHLMAISTVSYCRPDWAQEVINSYATDVKAQELLVQLAVLSPNSKGYALEEGLIRYKGRLFIGNNSALQTKLISAMHSSAVGGHSGVRATYQRVRKQYYWPGIKQQVEDWVKQCQLCQQAKHENTLPAGLLQPLPVPTRAWSDITMDFIDGLPKSEGYEVILVVVDRLTKYSHFIPLRRPYTAFSVATAFLDNVVKLHGVPASIVSDRDRVFTSTFWRQLFKVVGTKLSYSTAYHPQTDGQSERVNQCLEQYLRCAAHDSPTKWRKWLPMAEFWYNSSFHTSLGCSPFQALYGVEPNFGAMPNLGSATGTAITDVAAERQAFQDLLREHLLRAQVRMKNQADKHRSDRQFQVGDDVLLKLQPYVQSSLVQRPSAKMALKFYGPYKVLARVGATSYKLALPSDSKIHPVFHISQLKPFTPNYSPVFSELPSLVDFSTAEFYPQYILERRMVKRGNAAIPQIKVQWSSLSPDSATWEDYQVLRQRFPDASIWNGASTQGGESVTSPLPLAVVTDTKIDPG